MQCPPIFCKNKNNESNFISICYLKKKLPLLRSGSCFSHLPKFLPLRQVSFHPLGVADCVWKIDVHGHGPMADPDSVNKETVVVGVGRAKRRKNKQTVYSLKAITHVLSLYTSQYVLYFYSIPIEPLSLTFSLAAVVVLYRWSRAVISPCIDSSILSFPNPP